MEPHSAIPVQDNGLARRGLILVLIMLILTTGVGFMLFRPREEPPAEASSRPELVALAIPNLTGAFPANPNWAALAVLGDEMPSSPGWMVRYNAVLTLARRGSQQLPLDTMAEMLNERRQMRNFRVVLKDGNVVDDEQQARKLVLNALAALVEWHQHAKASAARSGDPEMAHVAAAIDELTRSESPYLRAEAAAVQKKQQSGKWTD